MKAHIKPFVLWIMRFLRGLLEYLGVKFIIEQRWIVLLAAVDCLVQAEFKRSIALFITFVLLNILGIKFSLPSSH